MFVEAIVEFPGRAMLSTEFMVDTGSPETMIDELYTSQRRVFANTLKFHKDIILGGNQIKLYGSGRTTLKFRNQEGELASVTTEVLDVAQNLGSVKGGLQRYSGFNIIGLSLFLDLKAKFFMDVANSVAYIET